MEFSIFWISFSIVAFRWFVSYYFYPNEPLLIKNIFDLEDLYYFPYIINLSEFNFNPNYTFYNYENNLLTIPIYSIFFHSLFYLIFSFAGFIIIELLSIYIFFYIFFKIFQEFKFPEKICIFLSLIIFFLPDIILFFFEKNQFNFINLEIFKNIYSFRVPRPIITSLYFFSGLLFLILILKNESEKDRNLHKLSIAILLGLCFGSFYYHFIFLSFTLFLIFLFKFFIEKKNFLYLFKDLIFIAIVCIIISLPFLALSFFAEPEALERIGLMHLDFSQKKIIINHLLSKIFNYKFIILFLINSFLLFLIFNLRHQYSKKASLVFYLLFLSTILAPLIFLIISPSVSEIYHFLNMTIIVGLINVFLFSTVVFLVKIKFIQKYVKIVFVKNLLNIGIILLVVLINIQYLNDFKDKNINNYEREDFSNLENLYKINNFKLNTLLTFDIKTQLWWIYKDKKLLTIDSSLNSQNHLHNELSFIDALKFLNISKVEFSEMINNKKKSWRYYNDYIRYFSWIKYQANSLITYKNTKNYDENLLDYIKKSSPTKTMQIIIPKDEQTRLINLFENRNNLNENRIDMIVLKKNSLIGINSKIDSSIFCKLTDFKIYDVYIRKDVSNCIK
jgi:hypothetical protein